jgi:DNA-binding CsgD family transcriptional regulator
LRASGERLHRSDPGSAEQLTGQELQIALTVAEGRSNRDVAAALFLSPRTVEWHLTRIYRKLDISSRAGLIRLFATNRGQDYSAVTASGLRQRGQAEGP